MNRWLFCLLLCFCVPVLPLRADAPASKLLLIGSGPDGHPAQTHEYMAGLKVIAKCLKDVPGLEITTVRADEPWKEGPELIARADGVVLFLSEGARWMNHDPKRREALAKMAKRGGGIVVLHWAMGTKDAANIDACLQLLGGCHGGPDRKYKVLETDVSIVDRKHPIAAGIKDFHVKDEFYYRLKFVKAEKGVHPLVQVTIDGQRETVTWSWERPDGGRSFGFSGLHFHDNWKLQAYRRLMAQGVLWTLKKPIPKDGLPVEVAEEDLKLGGEPLPGGVLARLGSPRLRHAGEIGPAVFSPDGKSLATGGADQAVRIWDVATGRQTRLLEHYGDLTALAFAPDGKRLAAGTAREPERLRLWDLSTGKQLWSIRPDGRSVVTLAFSPDGKTIAMAQDGGDILLLDAATGQERFQLGERTGTIRNLIFAPNGGSLAVCANERQVAVWDLASRKEKWSVTLSLPFRLISTVDFAADGKTLRISGRRLHERGGDLHLSAVIGTLDAATGKFTQGYTYETDNSAVASIALSPDGKVIAALCVDGMIHLWNAETGKLARAFRDSSFLSSGDNDLVFSPDGRVLAVPGRGLHRSIHMWDVSTGKAMHRTDSHEAVIRAIAVSPDGSRIATGGEDCTVRLWDGVAGKLLSTFPAESDVESLAFSPDGRTLAVGAREEARIWNVRSGKPLHQMHVSSCYIPALAFLPDGESLVSGHRTIFDHDGEQISEREGCIRIWDASTGREQRRLKGPPLDSSASPALVVRPDGREILALHADHTLRTWQAKSDKGSLLVNTCPPGVRLLSGTFSADGTLFAGNLGNGPFRVWDLARKGWQIPMSIPEGWGQMLAFSPDNRFLVTAGMRVEADAPAEERTIRLWEMASGEEAFCLPLPPANAVSCLAFRSDGRSLIAGMADTTILIWDLTAGPFGGRLDDAKLKRAWTDLAGEAKTAYRAMNRLALSPSEAAAFLSTRLRPATPPRPGLLAGLLADLDRNEFAVRERAERELEKLGGLAGPALRQALDGHPSLEVRRRIERLLAKLDAPAKPSTAELREGRAVAVLEWMGTPAARRPLRTLADGAAGSRLTRAAKAALERLAVRATPGS